MNDVSDVLYLTKTVCTASLMQFCQICPVPDMTYNVFGGTLNIAQLAQVRSVINKLIFIFVIYKFNRVAPNLIRHQNQL